MANPVDLPPLVKGESLFVADAAGSLFQLNWRTFDQDGKRVFPAPIKGLWAVGSGCVVWTSDGKVLSIADGRDLPVQWSLDLKGLHVAGAPLSESDQLWIACRDGTVVVVDQKVGAEIRRIRIPQALSMGIQKLDAGLFAVCMDGTLYPIDAGRAQ
jgi:hypothetical protein